MKIKQLSMTLIGAFATCTALYGCGGGGGSAPSVAEQPASVNTFKSIPLGSGGSLKVSAVDLGGFGGIPGILYSDISRGGNLLTPCLKMSQGPISTQSTTANGGVNYGAGAIFNSYALATENSYSASIKAATLGGGSINVAQSYYDANAFDSQYYTSSLYFSTTSYDLRQYTSSGELVQPSTKTNTWQRAAQNWSRCGIGYVNTSLGINSKALNLITNFNQQTDAERTSHGYSVSTNANVGSYASVSAAYGYAKSMDSQDYVGAGSAYAQFLSVGGDPTATAKTSTTQALLGSDIPKASTITPPAPLGTSAYTSMISTLSNWLTQMTSTPNNYMWVVPTIGFKVNTRAVTNNFITWKQDIINAPEATQTLEYQQIYESYVQIMKVATPALNASTAIDNVYNTMAQSVGAASNDTALQKYKNIATSSNLYTTAQVSDQNLYFRLLSIPVAAQFMMDNPSNLSLVPKPVSDVVYDCFSYQALVTGLASSPTSAQSQISQCSTATKAYTDYIQQQIQNFNTEANVDNSSLAFMLLNIHLQSTDSSKNIDFSNSQNNTSLKQYITSFLQLPNNGGGTWQLSVPNPSIVKNSNKFDDNIYIAPGITGYASILPAVSMKMDYFIQSLLNDLYSLIGLSDSGTPLFGYSSSNMANGIITVSYNNLNSGGFKVTQGVPLDYGSAAFAAMNNIENESTPLYSQFNNMPGNYLDSLSYNGITQGSSANNHLTLTMAYSNCNTTGWACPFNVQGSVLDVPYSAIYFDETTVLSLDKTASTKLNSTNLNTITPNQPVYSYSPNMSPTSADNLAVSGGWFGSLGTYDSNSNVTGLNTSIYNKSSNKFNAVSALQQMIPSAKNGNTSSAFTANDIVYQSLAGTYVPSMILGNATMTPDQNPKICKYAIQTTSTDITTGNLTAVYEPIGDCFQTVVLFASSELAYYSQSATGAVGSWSFLMSEPLYVGTRSLPNIVITYPANFEAIAKYGFNFPVN